MEILDLRLRDYPHFVNPPHLEILVDDIPHPREIPHHVVAGDMPFGGEATDEQGAIIFHGTDQAKAQARMKRTPGTFIWAEQEGYVHFLWHDPSYEHGALGGTYPTIDGGEVTLKKAWSSNPSAAEQFGCPPSVTVSITERSEVWAKGYTFWSANVTKAIVQDWLDAHDHEVPMIVVRKPDDGGDYNISVLAETVEDLRRKAPQ